MLARMIRPLAAIPDPRGHLLSRTEDQRFRLRATRDLDRTVLASAARRSLGHERRFRHAGLRVDLETHESPCPLDAIVVAKICTAHTTAAQRAMRRQC